MFSWKRNIVAIFIALKMVTLVVGQTNPPPRQTPNVITTSPTTQSIPTGLAKGVNPLGSYGGSNFDKINLFNGNVSMSFPLASLTSRGGMSAGVVLSYNSKLWYVDKVETDVTARIINEPSTVSVAYIPSYSEPDPEISSLGAGWTIHAGSLRVVSTAIYNKANRTCVFPGPGVQPVKPEKTISIVTFTAPDGTTYDFRDRIYDGEPRFLVNCEGVSRGKRFESKDGTAATFVSDTEIKDGFFSLSNTNISGYVYLRDGTRFRIEQGRVVKQRDNNGNIIEYTYEGNRLKRVTDNMGRTIEVRYDVSARILATVTVKGILGQARVTTIRGGRLENHLAANESRKNIDELFPVEAVQMSVPGFSFNPRTVSEVILPDSDPSGSPEGHEWEFKYNSYGEVVRVKTPARGVVEFDMGPNIGLNNGGYDTILNQIFRRVVARRTYPSDNGPIEGKVTYSDPTDPAKIDNGDVTVEQTEVDPNDGERILSKSTHKFSGHPKRGLDRMGGTPARTGYRPWLEGKELETEQFNFDGTTAMRRTITKYKQQSGVAWVAGADENTLAQPENNPRVTKITNSLLDGTTPKTSKTDYEYDQFNNVTREILTGYDNEVIREVERSYITTLNGIDYTALNAQEGQDLETVLDTHLRSLIDTETIKNGVGDAENTTKYEYDQYSGTNNAALVPRTLTVNTHAQRYQSPSRIQRGNVTSITTGVGKPEASTLYSHYDVLGNVVEVLGPNPNQKTETMYTLTSQFTFPEQTKQYVSGGISGERVLTSSRSFDFDTGAVLSSTGFNADTTTFQYNDQLDRLTLEIRPLDNAQGGFGRTSYTYSAPGAYPNTVEVKTSLDNGRVLSSKSEFDGFLRTTKQTRTDGENEGEPKVLSQTFYDALGRVNKVTNPLREGQTNPTDGYTTSQYDALSRVFRIQTFDNSNNLTGTVNTLYDTNLVTVTDQAGKQRKSETDAAGRLVKVYEPNPTNQQLDQITSYKYDSRSNLERVNQGEQVREFSYDALSRLISASSPESGTSGANGVTTYKYDKASNLIERKDPRNIITSYTYDSLNRLATKDYSDSTPSVNYFYDVVASNLPTGVTNPNNFGFSNLLGRTVAVASPTTTREAATALFHSYDIGGRIRKSSQLLDTQHYSTDSSYNLASLPIGHTYPSGRTISHSYNIAGQILGVMSNEQVISQQVKYTPSGSISSHRLGNGLYHQMKYNSRLQPTEIKLGSDLTGTASESVWKQEYNYGVYDFNTINNSTTTPTISTNQSQNNGNIGHIKLTPGSGTNTFNQFFVYDELNRLKLAKEFATPPNAPTNLQIDPNGGYNFILSWTDNSDNESGFFIERSRNGGPYEFIGLSFTNQNTFFDNPPGFNTNHCYRVRAFIGDINNVVDLEDLLSSDYSNISCATTGPEPPNPCDQCDEPDPDPGICDCCDADGCIRIFNFVGTGLPGYKGDSKLAIDAQLFGVSSISISPTGELFLADTNNRVIRKVDTTNIISTVVGNGKEALSNQTDVSAKSLSLSNTNSIVTNPKTGEMFFLSKNLINKFSTSTDKLSVVAGSGRLNPSLSSSAKDSNLGSPSFIDFDNQGNLYLVSQTKEKLSQIFKIDSNGKIISILGKDTPSSLSSNIKDSSFSTITAFAVDKANGDIYFTDSRELIVKKLSSKTGEISNFFGGGTNAIKTGIASTSVSLDQTPTALLVSSSGTVYVATSKAGTKASIYSINPDLTFKLFAGGLIRYPVIKDSDSVDLVLPKGLALDKEGNLFVADSARHRVLFLSKDGAKTTPSQPSSSVNVINEPPINPLVGPNTSSWSQAYSYDRYGNRLSVEGTNAQSLNISAGKNRINDAGYEYDLAGNLTKDPSDKFYFYDAENRLVKVSIDQAGSNIIAQYFYDGNGWRIKKASSSTTRFVYDQSGRLLSEYDGETAPAMSAPTREHIYAPSGMLATVEPDKINYHTPDHLGSPRVLTDAVGSVISRRDFFPFGDQIFNFIGNRAAIFGYSVNDSIKQRFTGYFRDEEVGLDFAQARHFNGALGRFMQPDEFNDGPVEVFAVVASNNPTFYADITDPQTLNKYQYCYNNPLGYIDPTGHQGGAATLTQSAPLVSDPKAVAAALAAGFEAAGPLGAFYVGVGILATVVVPNTPDSMRATASRRNMDGIGETTANRALLNKANEEENDKLKASQVQTNQPGNVSPSPEQDPNKDKDSDKFTVNGQPLYRNGKKEKDFYKVRDKDLEFDEKGNLLSTRGISSNLDPNSAASFGPARRIVSLPAGLKAIQIGKPGHYELVTTKPGATKAEYESLVNRIKYED
jgi:RHS repeat-associated protein